MECFCPRTRTINCSIIFLDDHTYEFPIEDDNNGQVLLEEAFRHLNLMETAYFGLRFLDQRNQTHWLDPVKLLRKQLNWNNNLSHEALPTYVLYFGVKFYAVDPCKLIEEITRYQFFLQVKQDVLQGRLPVSFEMAAELGGYIVQSELGDYDAKQHTAGYLSEFRFLHSQTIELENRVGDYHKLNVGMPPSMAELNYLDKVKWLELYGVDLHAVLGDDNVDYFLGLTPSGIVVLRNTAIVGNYYWPRITKIHFTGCYFMLRVADKNNDESTYGFETPSKAACKHLWKCCLEHHAFFRLYQVSPGTAADIFGLGSRFRFSGRTEKQAAQDAKMCARKPPTFSRTLSRRRNADDSKSEKNSEVNKEIKLVSIPQPVQVSENPYRSLTNIRSHKPETNNGGDSPRSIRSAPWSQTQIQRGLYGVNSNKCSLDAIVSTLQRSQTSTRHRSSSVDSHSSTDSKNTRRHRHHQSRAASDNESELSKSSSRSHRRHRHSSGHRRSTGSDVDLHQDKSKYEDYKLVDSGSQWREVQRQKHIMNGRSIQQASIVTNRRSSVVNSCHESESEMSYRHNASRRHRKHRSRSRSPAEAKAPWLSDELKKHVEFDLIDTTGMTQAQLKEIPYTVVKTSHAKQIKLKYGNNNNTAKKNGSTQVKSKTNDYRNSNYNNLGGFSHEHTDSGLGPEQEFEDRWVQSRRFETGRSPSVIESTSTNPLSASKNEPTSQHSVSRNSPRLTHHNLGGSHHTKPNNTLLPSASPYYSAYNNHSINNNNNLWYLASRDSSNTMRVSSTLDHSSSYSASHFTNRFNNGLNTYAYPNPSNYGSLGRAFVHRDGPLRICRIGTNNQHCDMSNETDETDSRKDYGKLEHGLKMNGSRSKPSGNKPDGPGEMTTEL